MKKSNKILTACVIALTFLAFAAVQKYKRSMPDRRSEQAEESPVRHLLPALIDFGDPNNIACRAMTPAIEKIEQLYAGVLAVRRIDVTTDKKTPARYKIKVIPCQIIVDANENEIWRNEGFIGADDIIISLKKLGIETK